MQSLTFLRIGLCCSEEKSHYRSLQMGITSYRWDCVLLIVRGLKTRCNRSCFAVNSNRPQTVSECTWIESFIVSLGMQQAKKLKSLCVDAGVTDQDFLRMLDTVEAQCEICKRYRRPPLRPVVGFSMAREFNDTVALDLKQWQPKLWFCHMIDLATRYSVCEVVKSKEKEVILHAVMTGWIAKFGSPRQFLSDNGGEFSNEAFIEMAESFNIRVCTTAAESPWSNGVNERYNGIIAGIVKRVMADTQCSLEIALAWAVSAKNSLETHLGFSPNQLVFGHNPNMPNILVDKPSALEPPSGSKLVRTHLNAMHAARQAFIQNGASEKLRRSLLHQVRPTGEKFFLGDAVFYRRHQDDKWRGPGTVIGQESKQVLVKHGGVYYRCHPSCIMKETTEMSPKPADATRDTGQEPQPQPNSGQEASVTMIRQPDRSVSHQTQSSFDQSDDDAPAPKVPHSADSPTRLEQRERAAESLPEEDIRSTENATGSSPKASAQSTSIVHQDRSMLPRAQSRVTYVLRNSSEWRTATILGRAGKATGKNKFHMNILDDDDEDGKCVDWRDVDDWKDLHQDVYFCPADDVLIAKLSELEQQKQNDVYSSVPDSGQNCISCRWVVTEKQDSDGRSQIKARLVARGFEEDTSSIHTDSPTCGKESLRVVLAIAASQKWGCHSIDVKAAFLQGSPLEGDVFLRPPPEANTGPYVWKIKTCVYGLNDASRYWYLRVREELVKLGMVVSKLDAALFYWRTKDGIEGIFTCHVDDFHGADPPDSRTESSRDYDRSSSCGLRSLAFSNILG